MAAGRLFLNPAFRELFFPEDHFAVANELVVQPKLVFVGGRFAARTWRAAEETHAGGRLKNIRRKGAAIHIKFDAQISGVGDPGDLVAVVEYDRLRDESDKYWAFSHFSLPSGSAREQIGAGPRIERQGRCAETGDDERRAVESHRSALPVHVLESAQALVADGPREARVPTDGGAVRLGLRTPVQEHPRGQLHDPLLHLRVDGGPLGLVPDAPPLGTIRSLTYFSPVIDEVLDLQVSQNYFHYLRFKIDRLTQTTQGR